MTWTARGSFAAIAHALAAGVTVAVFLGSGAAERANAETRRASSPPTTLARLRDHSRPVVLVAPTASDPRLQQELRSLEENAAGATERQMVTVVLTADGSIRGLSTYTVTTLTTADARALRERLGVATQDFALVLIGKDGGDKLRADAPVLFDRLAAHVDSMPMRRAEMAARRR